MNRNNKKDKNIKYSIDKKIIYEDVNSEEYLTEMAQFRPGDDFEEYGFILSVNPENKKGNPYFKVYNSTKYSSATKVLRVSFRRPEVIKNHAEIGGKKEWKISDINSKFKKNLIQYLNSYDMHHGNITVWTAMRFEWNSNIKNIPGVKKLQEYISGKYDTVENLKNPDYIPYNIQMPNYMELH